MWNLKYGTDDPIYTIETDSQTWSPVVAKGQGRQKGWSGSSGLAEANSCIGWINNKILLYSTGNYIHSPGINHNGKEYEKVLYICITESLCCTADINTICKSTIVTKSYGFSPLPLSTGPTCYYLSSV